MGAMLRSTGLVVLIASGLFVACSSSSAHTVADAGHRPDAGGGSPDAAPVGCTTTAGTSGTLLRGTLLLPSGPAQGELLISSAGLITCAAASCSGATGYGAATIVDCPGSVVSPGLINPHDHTDYATVGPGSETHGNTRYNYRLDWLDGADSTTPLPYVKSTNDIPTVAAQEVRLVLGGGTSVIGSGGVNGLARNLAAYNSTTGSVEGLTGNTVYFDTFPLDNDAATGVITSGCAYPRRSPKRSSSVGATYRTSQRGSASAPRTR
jgi:large repetitive protein